MRKILYIIPLFIFAFTFTGGPPSGWYQQTLPDLGGRSIQDIFFLDSLTGWAVTNATNQNPDTTYVLKTINGGDNWFIQYSKIQTGGGFPGYFKVYFLNANIGYTCGVKGLDKTTDGGTSWTSLNAPLNSYLDMSIINEDTIWSVSSNSLTGGVFRTTNGGVNWTQQLNLGSQNPNKIYMYNNNLGFISGNTGTYLRRTTNSGQNWEVIPSENGFLDIEFIDANTGWKANGSMKKTTDGGISWINQQIQTGGYIQLSGILNFSIINPDTIWGVGGYVLFPNNQVRGILHRTTNGGNNWLYQIPDTSISIFPNFIDFIDHKYGWAYENTTKGIHTKIGGDTIFLSIQQTSAEMPEKYYLHQNYPNPFNPTTNISFDIKKTGIVSLRVFDITGKEILKLVDQNLSPGQYRYTFDGSNLSSGIYFYKLQTENYVDTKKMMLVK